MNQSNPEAPDVRQVSSKARPTVRGLSHSALRSLGVWCSIMTADSAAPGEDKLADVLFELFASGPSGPVQDGMVTNRDRV
ncbi:hypothetical protein [Novosphingobium malaysiense]|uniref:hypothetical protein n=1 Tax=Novosphingobium malaysiense TaxID=1348853 RepID=UPI000AD843C7|nr:hypothetical protein [Novosphingobium malaysiense]